MIHEDFKRQGCFLKVLEDIGVGDRCHPNFGGMITNNR
jgi:hypothetical protein